MAKSKSGGTRSYIRGRVGADVYSIGRDAKGAKQQVVRSLAETVANPQTLAQMRGRMIMSTVMQAVSVMRPIIDHSFDNVPAGQPSISEFISRNYALIKADVAAHPASGNAFGLVIYGGKGMQNGYYIISQGEAEVPAGLGFTSDRSAAKIAVGENGTYGDLVSKWGMTSDEYLTLVSFLENDIDDINKGIRLVTARLRIKSGLNAETVITAENAAAAFDIEGDVTPTFSLSDGVLKIDIATASDSNFYGCNYHIVTRKVNGAFIHSTCVLSLAALLTNTADVALPTYPVGTQMYLNGGDI